MTGRIGVLLLMAAAFMSSACELPGLERPCFGERDCERHPVNAISGIGLSEVSGPGVNGVDAPLFPVRPGS